MEDLPGAPADGVDDDVDPSEPPDRFEDHPLAVGFAGQVGLDREALRAGGGADPRERRLQRRRRPAGHDHLRPGAREGLRQGSPDGTASAADDGHTTLQAEDGELAQSCSSRGGWVRS